MSASSPKLVKRRLKASLFLFFIVLFLCSCGSSASTSLWQRQVERGWKSGFTPLDLAAPPFRLAGLLKGSGGTDLAVYLEGDGRAVVGGRPSQDPTPVQAQSLELAFLDPSPLVLYLARVGQFMPAYAGPQYQTYWSNGRLAPEVVEAASRAIDEVKSKTGATRIHLVGFSGGGGLAVLLAESRSDVVSLVTVAGLLDTEWWVQNSGWLPLTGSLNPASRASSIVLIPQIHFYGLNDRIITPDMSLRFSKLAPFQSFSREGLALDHYRGWTAAWPNLLKNRVIPLRSLALPAGAEASGPTI
ncbi:MAG: alpha/beta hydrolase [Deltaproteobacteria bacterium]|jgi:pimeloyl-ACP methyl ester carboxylesterase|nr:alpha/beta hydrolase [Deltaproteobacteria bacterium]